ncbi:NtaA/DmoA family FMN-dependent monooxygenase [Sphingobium sp. JS3065]|uniref:NtaA/DmoA family FMN-dependent monooxygenase n=1 Tax=Sphingobium sp. JS3065 TaxID=2970925 RepID=UPI002263EB9E|nr:NtaA/DmoA family FMN-dependent monooxygenase [Sphingobium sp. JS3065]UZW57251.1 NtaA/DmoA family FMN-dependent monooxygenase [Sphingobium sp. JS3065]
MTHIPLAVMPHIGGWHLASWRRPASQASRSWDPYLWIDLARAAERAKFDAIFFGDQYSLIPVPEHLRPNTARMGSWDALVISTAIAAQTSKVGIVATAFTEFVAPYAMARQFATLDHISAGRVAWNVVTSGTPGDQRNFSSKPLADPVSRYERAAEYVDVVKGLWDSWEDDAVINDRESGVFFDAGKLHKLDHHGKHFDITGPLNVARPVQGYPVIAQAGGSGPGKQLAGSIGELLFTPLSGTAAAAYCAEVREIAGNAGRKPGEIIVLAQLTPIVGKTREEAEEKWRWLQSKLPEELLRQPIELMLGGVDLAEFSPDTLITDLELSGGIEGFRNAVLSYRNADGSVPTIAELLRGYRGPGTVVGSAEDIADYMELEVAGGCCDGFLLLLHGVPEDFEDFCELVVPELRKRGRFRSEYDDDGTLRGRLGLQRPANRHGCPV